MIATELLNCSKSVIGVFIGVIVLSWSLGASAEQGLGASSQTKVNKAKAKGWSSQDVKKDGYTQQNEKTLVNIGSKRAGNCSVNVGTAKPGEKAPKEIVVTTKEVINICK